MKKWICFSIAVLMIMLFSSSVIAAGNTNSYSYFDGMGNQYLEIFNNGTWKTEGSDHDSDRQDDMFEIIIGHNSYIPNAVDFASRWWAWELSYGREENGTLTGNTAEFYSLDAKGAYTIINTDFTKMCVTLGIHDKYYDEEPCDNYFGVLGGGDLVFILNDYLYLEGSAGYSLYGTDKAGDNMNIFTYKAKLFCLFSEVSGLTLGYRYYSYENDAGQRNINSGITLGLSFLL